MNCVIIWNCYLWIFFPDTVVVEKIGKGDEACSVNIVCRASSFGLFFPFPNICFSDLLLDLKLSPKAILLCRTQR